MSSLPLSDATLERILSDPGRVFERPKDVLKREDLSDLLKTRILQCWRLELHKQLTHSSRDVPELHEFELLEEVNQSLLEVSEP